MSVLAGDGFVAGARRRASPNCDARPPGTEVSLLVLHSISLPPGEFGGDAVERLFTNRLDPAAHPFFGAIAGLKVSAHFYLRRDGGLVQFVSVQRRAWHAGESEWRGRGGCNDYSIGIELEGTEQTEFSEAQYRCLAQLVRVLRAELPLRDVAAHSDVAPRRKADPGACFDWLRFYADIARA